MPSQLQIDQDGLAAGTPGVSRTDGKADGSLVTLFDTSPGDAVSTFRILWTPPGDVDAVSTLSAAEPKQAFFVPTAGKYGTYLVELARPGELPERRAIVMRTPNLGLVIPALSERGDQTASFAASGIGEFADNNATDFDDPDLNALPWASWWRAMHELIMRVDAGAVRGQGTAPGQPPVWNGEAWVPLLSGEPLSVEHIITPGGALNLDAPTVVGALDGAVGFFGTNAIARPSVSGTEGSALANSLANALAELGLITDGR